MNLKNFLILNAILFVPFGLAMIVMPGTLFPMFGIDLADDGILMARVFGSALMSIGLMCWLVRSAAPDAIGMKAILVGNFVFHAIDALSTGIASYGSVMNSLGWMFSGLHLVLAVGFLVFLMQKVETEAAVSTLSERIS